MKTICTGSAASALILLALSSCDPAPGRKDGAGNAATAAEISTTRPAAVPPAAPPDPAPAPLILEGGGLRIFRAPRTVAFETPQSATIEAIGAALGGPPTERGSNAECGGGGGLQFAAWKDRITLWFENERFIGWDAEGDLRTAGGVGIGSRRGEVAALPGFELVESTLGIEFAANGLGGILASNAADARVTHLWGGATCLFR